LETLALKAFNNARWLAVLGVRSFFSLRYLGSGVAGLNISALCANVQVYS
jgi:hypothetical protein